MTTISGAVLRTLHGPSIFADFPAVVLEFEASAQAGLDPESLLQALTDTGITLSATNLLQFRSEGESLAARHLAAAIARWLDACSAPAEIEPLAFAVSLRGSRSAVAASFFEQARSARILRDAIALASAVLDWYADPTTVTANRRQAIRRLIDRSVEPGAPQGSEALTFARARRRDLPVRLLHGTPKILLLGHGRHGRLLHSTSNDRDSFVGTILAADKSWSNALVQRLGYPGVRHRIVHHENEAEAAARAIGFPLVVKPVARGKGVGVFAGVTSLEECRSAIASALRQSRRGVLVEGQVEGDDHRLTVVGGRFAWAVARRAASVCGDGLRSIADLIAAENARRLAIPPADRHLITAIGVDAELVAHLAKSELTLQSVPAAGRRVSLRSIANVSRGGTYEDVTERVHPDNRAMAEAIAAALRMDTLGIDFMTTDITRSWRDSGGAVIEVNETPGAGTPHYVDRILDGLYPEGSPARVPYLLFAGEHPAGQVDKAIAAARRNGHVVGFVDASTTAVNDELRGSADMTLNQRMQSLLPDTRVGMIVAHLTATELLREGILLERIDRAFLGSGLPRAVEALVRRHSALVRVLADRVAS